ncbi:hypothetical protein BGX26_012413 [Mortierella sp. AD094]|nr:hypothetical protein BGX26_012413 [Mortierella sp. AD094]
MAQMLGQHSSPTVSVEVHLGDIPTFLRLESIDLQQLVRRTPIKTSAEIESVRELEHNVATANGKMTICSTWQKAAFQERERENLLVSELERILFEDIKDGRETYLFKDAHRACRR